MSKPHNQFWAVFTPKGHCIPTSVAVRRSKALERFMFHPDYGVNYPWPSLRAQGYRVCRVVITEYSALSTKH